VLRRLLRKGNLAASYLRILSRAFSGRVADQHPFAHDEESFCWGVVQLVGRCTVNADGGGSNPPAPATSENREPEEHPSSLIFDYRNTGFGPAAPAAVH
jgi:hypothetical protein